MKIIYIYLIIGTLSFGDNINIDKFYQRGVEFKNGYNEKEKDIKFAKIWFEESAKNGNVKSNLELGLIYYNEEKNYLLAHEYFLKSFEESESKYYLSLMYENGNGVPKNIEKSNQLLQAAIEKKDYQPAILKYEVKEKKEKFIKNKQ